MKKKLILVGGGGHCKACIDVIEACNTYDIAAIIDVEQNLGKEVLGYPINGGDEDIPGLVRSGTLFLITIGQIKSPAARIRAWEMISRAGGNLATIISPFAYVSPFAQVGRGTIVMHHAMVNAGANIGENCIINSKALIEHDATIGDFCHVSTGAVVNGESTLEREVFVGSNAVVRERIAIGEKSIIGCGLRVCSHITANQTIKTT